MTNEEAIEILDEMGGCCSIDLEYVACHIAIEAIEKQIRKQVAFVSKGSYIQFCPRCDKPVAVGQHYCSECGQALDWS